MESKPETRMTIHRVGAEPIRIMATLSPERSRNMASAIEKGMDAKYLGLELDGKLIIIPAHQIACIEIEPAPRALIAHVIRDVRKA